MMGTAQITHKLLANSVLRVGLSWPNLAKAWGTETPITAAPKQWWTLFLGSQSEMPAKKSAQTLPALVAIGKKPAPGSEAGELDPAQCKGLIVLDGTWAQAKALWWRNAWLLKTQRVALLPSHASRYGNMRREPRSECVASIESVAESFRALGTDFDIADQLDGAFTQMLERIRKSGLPTKSRDERSGGPSRDRRGGFRRSSRARNP